MSEETFEELIKRRARPEREEWLAEEGKVAARARRLPRTEDVAQRYREIDRSRREAGEPTLGEQAAHDGTVALAAQRMSHEEDPGACRFPVMDPFPSTPRPQSVEPQNIDPNLVDASQLLALGSAS